MTTQILECTPLTHIHTQTHRIHVSEFTVRLRALNLHIVTNIEVNPSFATVIPIGDSISMDENSPEQLFSQRTQTHVKAGRIRY